MHLRNTKSIFGIMMNAETIISDIQSLPASEQQKVHEFFLTQQIPDIHQKVQAGIDQLNKGMVVEGDAMFQRLLAKAKSIADPK